MAARAASVQKALEAPSELAWGTRVDGGLVPLEQLDQGIALAAGQLRELERHAVPGVHAVAEILIERELARGLAHERQALADPGDLIGRRAVPQQGGAGAGQRLLQRFRGLGPAVQRGPEAVGVARRLVAAVQADGLGRGLGHQAVEMLHLEPARHAQDVPPIDHRP